MKLCILLVVFTVFKPGFSSMAFKDLGITADISRIATSLNDIFKESFELMTGSLGKHGVYYLPEINEKVEYKGMKVVFHAFNGWLQNPVLKSSKTMSSGALRKYKVSNALGKEVFLVCVECFQVYAESVKFCYEATGGGKNSSGAISTGPISYVLSLQIRVSQPIRRYNNEDEGNNELENCNVTLGERSFEVSDQSELRTEVRGLRSLNFLASSIDGWVNVHLNSTVKTLMEEKLLASLNKVVTKHDMCDEFIVL
ncbi:uncharacterized protein LOC129001867 [Macrosteles quadrilineatus]|uniref:uncharacterized protein LOC129001867 n=1 Tax=Macrosteles quadrilineatus TaxID=74068 RepID=UPI0023E11154|nr:uncharacterized protein LOC129001867 [Macrosteles quadrilineatus]